jgi:hypothetical protein
MFQIIFYHLICQLTRSHAKVTPCPKMTSPIALFQIRKTFEQLHRTSSFNPSHNFARRQIGWRRKQNMDMILADNSFQNFYLKGFTSLSNQFTNFQTNVAFLHLVAIFCDKHKMILNLKNRMAAITVIHKPFPFSVQDNIIRQKIIAKSDRLKGGGFNLTSG